MASGNERARIVVRGRVQGVGFRAFTIAEAGKIPGTVTNRSDGAVECVAEGSREELERLIDTLRRGPMMARVDSVEVTWEPASGTYTSMRAN